jgi:alpha-mannosidase
MIVNKKTIMKLERLLDIYKREIYTPLADLKLEYGETFKHFRTCPEKDLSWKPVKGSFSWGEAWQSIWMKGSFKVPADFTDNKLYIQADTGAVEVLLMVDDQYKGILNIETEEGVRGHHHTRLALSDPVPGSVHRVALECYAGHPCPGTMPFDKREQKADLPGTYVRTFRYARICHKNSLVSRFVTELRVLLQIARITGPDSFRGAKIYAGLLDVFRIIPQQPADYSPDKIDSFLEEALLIMKPLLTMKNGDSAPRAAIIGHSHMDTAWLWTVAETRRKCARTFSNTLNLMDEYKDYMFLQSSPYHLQMMKEDYPQIYEGIKERIAQGRWEPNGGSWLEPDCNIPSGEAFTRHFLYGQKFLKENFNYRADVFWQPDVFGYSASLPQILKQCGISHFLTTKLSWNEENRFPYDTFRWSGIDGSQVLTHFNTTHCWPDPESLINQTNDILHKDIQDSRFCAFGYGDGGGGPLYEMLETAPLMKDIEGVPKTEYTRVSDFMSGLDKEAELPVWIGELYLELHRGTLTSFHKLKRLNRQVENLLRDGEYLYSRTVIDNNGEYPARELERLWKELLRNQFHDILPGTSIGPVNKIAVEEMTQCYIDVQSLINKINDNSQLGKSQKKTGTGENMFVRLINNRGWGREDIAINNIPHEYVPAGSSLEWQKTVNLQGEEELLVSGISVPAFGEYLLTLTRNKPHGVEKKGSDSFYSFKNELLETSFYIIKFARGGEIVSLFDKSAQRELVLPEGALNNLVLGEDIPALWDNWDIDYDQHMKNKPLDAEGPWKIIQEGPLQLRLINRYKAGLSSEITQHIVLRKNSPLIEFETRVDWQETHKLLKAEFDLDIQTDRARHEIQYGHLERNTHENLSQDRMQFEVSNHRWTDLSEPGYGAALINDCKYGISVKGSTLGLSLLKCGTHPDPAIDRGIHFFKYALLPHGETFSVKEVVRPACEFNSPLIQFIERDNKPVAKPLFQLGAENILLESMKQAEDGQGIIFRLFEGEKKKTSCSLEFNTKPRSIWICNMLEENSRELQIHENGMIDLDFYGFEIKSLRVIW